jgi:Xaa-Pro aminopeptidase
MTEFETKLQRLRGLLADKKLDALLMRRTSSFAWATCGAASYINTASTYGEASLLVTAERRFLITNNIEAPRLEREEPSLAGQDWQFHIGPWHEPSQAVARLVGKGRLGADDPYPGAVDVSAEMARLRHALTPEEGARFRELGRLSGEAMQAAIQTVRPGQTEFEIAASLLETTERRGVQPVVVLVATDDRISAFRHPLPTAKPLERYAMLILCGRLHGLIASITRLVHFGKMPGDLHHTRPGRRLREVFAAAAEAYAAAGYPDEWRLHHQGGSAGYEPREVLGTPTAEDVVLAGQAYAWNPSITGAKSEDTILIGESGNEVLTAIPGWPKLSVSLDGEALERPAVLEVT